MERVENTISRFFSGIITATPYIKSRFIKLNSNTIDINNYPIIDEFIDLNPYWETKENNICYVGGVTKKRGILELINAFSYINGNLLVAGSITGNDTKILLRLCLYLFVHQ